MEFTRKYFTDKLKAVFNFFLGQCSVQYSPLQPMLLKHLVTLEGHIYSIEWSHSNVHPKGRKCLMPPF